MKRVSLTKKGKLFLCVLLCVALVGASVGIVAFADDKAQKQEVISDLSGQLAALKQEQQAIQQQISAAKTEKEKKLAEQKALERQAALTQQEINLLEAKIELLEAAIAEKEEELTAKQAEIDINYAVFKQRMRAFYMSGLESSWMELLLGIRSFSSTLSRSEMLERVAAHDKELIEQLVIDRQYLAHLKEQIEANKAEVEQNQAELRLKKQMLNTQVSKTAAQVQNIANMEAQYLASLQASQARSKAIQAEIDKVYASMTSTGDYVGGEFLWPLPGFQSISSYFGWRFNNTDYHTGIDITGSGVYGSKIVAANAGTVKYVGYQPDGYGNYLIIDHGGGYTTLYGHTSEILVSTGQYVTRGQAIARVGSTGWSTGPHLHFEIRTNGTAQNPLPYLQ